MSKLENRTGQDNVANTESVQTLISIQGRCCPQLLKYFPCWRIMTSNFYISGGPTTGKFNLHFVNLLY